ncbi:MAG: hypothetical protein AAF125_04005, partial [Chloroflexota bacterium]
ITNIDGDLWEWDGANTPKQLTSYGWNGLPVQSPDGRQVAYLSVPSVITSDGDAFVGAGGMPQNIWVLDRDSASFERVADDTNGLRYRGQPTWSPDSTQLAWTELSEGDDMSAARVMVYDLTTRTTRTLISGYDLGLMDGGLFMPPLSWGAAGLARLRYTVILGPSVGDILLEIIDPTTGGTTSYTVGQTGTNTGDLITDYVWAVQDKLPVIAFVTRAGTWWTLNPANGVRTDLTNAPQLRATQGRINFILTPNAEVSGNDIQFSWSVREVLDGGATRDDRLPYRPTTLSNHGMTLPGIGSGALAWSENNTLFAWTNSGPQTVLSGGDIAQISPNNMRLYYGGAPWLPTVWEVNAASTGPSQPLPGNASLCTPSPSFRAGDTVRVTAGAPNNLRELPNTGAGIVGRLPAGTIMRVLDVGPCAEGYHWYEVLGTEWRGWTAGGPSDTWLELMDRPNLVGCPLPPRLTIGMNVTVTPGVPNNVRTGPSVSAPISSTMSSSGFAQVVDGPVCADGLVWWGVSGQNDSGWTAEGQDGVYWLEPVGG